MRASRLILYSGVFGEESFIKTSVDLGVDATHILEPKLNLIKSIAKVRSTYSWGV